jgi:hypothetical protein
MVPVLRRLPIIAILVTVAIAFPLGVIASHQFTDVPNTNTFHADIDALRDAGVTTGCAPSLYCPKDFVTREQMAAFLNRLGALQAGKTPVVNADKVDGKDEVLGAGDIVIRQLGDWHDSGNSGVTIMHTTQVTSIFANAAGERFVLLSLQGPASIDGRTYGVKSVEICYGVAINASITHTSVRQSLGNSAVPFIDDPTNRPAGPGCYTITDPIPTVTVGGVSLAITLTYSAAGEAVFSTVSTTWAPASEPLS